jgi:hypothetical protein
VVNAQRAIPGEWGVDDGGNECLDQLWRSILLRHGSENTTRECTHDVVSFGIRGV